MTQGGIATVAVIVRTAAAVTLAAAAVAAAAIAAFGCAPGSRTDAQRHELYFLSGQSNMDGYGYVAELPAELKEEVERVMIFTGLAALDDSVGGIGVWEPLRPGHGTGFETDGTSNQISDRFGPELTFGRTIAELKPRSRIAIVKYSMGGTGLAAGVGYGSWDPDYAKGEGINQYDHALTTIRNALAVSDIDGDGRLDRLVPAGIVWMQGEADAFDSQESAAAYEVNLKRMMNLLRAALRVDDLPVVVGKVTDSGMAEDGSVMDYIDIVQRAQASFAEKDECATLVTITDGLAYLDDGWHYDTEGYLRLGTAFAEATIGLDAACASTDR